MQYKRFPANDGNGFFTIAENGDCEYCNPGIWFRECITASLTEQAFSFMVLSLSSAKPPEIPEGEDPVQYLRKLAEYDAKKTWNGHWKKICSSKVPDELMQVLSIGSKNGQKKTLKNLAINMDQLIFFFCKAYYKQNFLFSNFTYEFLPANIDSNIMPRLAYLEEDKTVTIVGQTSYSESQLKQAVEHRRRRVVRIIDKDKDFHCFFYDFKSLAGEETDSQGPHLHYISDKWGLSRKTVLESLSEKRYKIPSVHISFIDRDFPNTR